MTAEPREGDPLPAPRFAAGAAATIARVLEEVGIVHPERVDFETSDGDGVLARVVIEQGVCELLCELTREGNLISARLIEL